MSENQPIERFRAGRVTCALFKHDTENDCQLLRVLSAVVSRRFKDDDGNWADEFEFNRADIPLAIYVLKRAFITMTDRHIKDQIDLAIERAASGTLPQSAKSSAA